MDNEFYIGMMKSTSELRDKKKSIIVLSYREFPSMKCFMLMATTQIIVTCKILKYLHIKLCKE